MFFNPGKICKYQLTCLIALLLLLGSTATAVPNGKLIIMTYTVDDSTLVVTGAEVSIEGANSSAISDENGRVVFENMPVGLYSISAAVGNMKIYVKDVKVNQDLVTTAEIWFGNRPISCLGYDVSPIHKNLLGINTIGISLGGDPVFETEEQNENSGSSQIGVSINGNVLPGNSRMTYFATGNLARQQYAPGWSLLPHTNSEFYSGQGELSYSKGPFNFAVGGSVTRNQYGYYNTLFKYDLDHYASRMDKNSQLTASFKHEISENINYSLSYSRNKINSIAGVRKGYSGGYQGWFSDYKFNQPYPHSWFTDPENPFYTGDTLDGYLDFHKDDPNINPYGIAKFFYTGDYPRYREWQYANNTYQADFGFRLNRTHNLAAVFEARFNDESSKNTLYPSSGVIDTSSGLIKVFYTYMPEVTNFKPAEYSVRLSDAMEFDRLQAKVGLRYDIRKFTTYNSNYLPSLPYEELFIDSVRHYISPMLGLTLPWHFMTLTASYDRHFLDPEAIYLRPEPFNLGPLAIANLKDQFMLAQATDAFNVEVTGEPSGYVKAGLGWQYQRLDGVVNVNKFDSPYVPSYLSYTSAKGSLKALEAKLDIKYFKYLKGSFDYTSSWAKTTKEAEEIYITYASEPEWFPKVTYDSDFDQRRLFISGVSLALDKGEGPRIFGLHPLENLDISLKHTIAGGLPYTRTDLNGNPLEKANSSRLQGISRTDLSLSRSFALWQVNCKLELEVTNLFNAKDTIYVDPATGLADNNGWYESGKLEIYRTPITRYFPDGTANPMYDIKADLNRDDYISADEHYLAAVKANDDIQKDMNNGRAFYYGRQMRLMLGIKF